MKTYDIYIEGFVMNGQSGHAGYIGSAKGNTFKEACAEFFKNSQYYNKENNTEWACGLYETLEEAQKSFR